MIVWWQVSIMQQELKELQPELIETSKETEQLIKIIADETLEVEEKKQVSTCVTVTWQQKTTTTTTKAFPQSWLFLTVKQNLNFLVTHWKRLFSLIVLGLNSYL